jgi:hypothetical protein
MKSRGMRVLLVILALAAQVGSGLVLWRAEQRVAAQRSAADTFEREARQAVVRLGELGASLQACVARGQSAEVWLGRAQEQRDAIGPRLAALRKVAENVEAQSALEGAIEAFAAFGQSDAKAREYLKSGQPESASDVIFAEGAAELEKAAYGVDGARGRESVWRAVSIEKVQRWELVALGAAFLLTLLSLLLLFPVPLAPAEEAASEVAAGGEADATAVTAERAGTIALKTDTISKAPATEKVDTPAKAVRGLGLTIEPASTATPVRSGWPPTPAAPPVTAPVQAPPPDLTPVADLCLFMARVQDTNQLQGLVERITNVLDATGVIVWMPDASRGVLRPALSCGYSPLALMRMGAIQRSAENATATAFRTERVRIVPAGPLSSGAVVAPLVTAEGCAGVMAVELKDGVSVTPQVRATVTIIAAQLATLLTPVPPQASTTTPGPSPGGPAGKL